MSVSRYKITPERLEEIGAEGWVDEELQEVFDLAMMALKAPRLTLERVERLYRLALVVSGPETFAALLLELGIEVESAPPESVTACPNCEPAATGTHTADCRALREF